MRDTEVGLMVLEEMNGGMWGSHIKARALKQKILRSGVFLPSIATDAQDHRTDVYTPRPGLGVGGLGSSCAEQILPERRHKRGGSGDLLAIGMVQVLPLLPGNLEGIEGVHPPLLSPMEVSPPPLFPPI
ncbi:hypothetical protein LIER_11621 [Lithospermum erythrorhizon]|uniref:Uncharacterized protein n=1 Tax=Lithospermum erythrorhizon TaxID=34254 RepID=A0AAV3PNQ7_LITER